MGPGCEGCTWTSLRGTGTTQGHRGPEKLVALIPVPASPTGQPLGQTSEGGGQGQEGPGDWQLAKGGETVLAQAVPVGCRPRRAEDGDLWLGYQQASSTASQAV